MAIVIRRRRRELRDGVDKLLSETSDMVTQLVRQNRALKAQNQRLAQELERVSEGWEQIKRLARSAPRKRRSRIPR